MSVSYVPLISASVPHTWYSRHVNKAPYYVIHFTWLLLGTVLSLSYSSNLLANLVKVELEFQPQTLQVCVLQLRHTNYVYKIDLILQDVLDMEVGVYVLKNSVMPQYLEESPLKLQQRIYAESVVNRGGYYVGSVMPPQDIIDNILTKHQMALLTGDSQAAFKHMFSMVKEEANSGPCGYYFKPNLPLKYELLKALMRFRDTGIIQKVILTLSNHILGRVVGKQVQTLQITSKTNWKLSMPWRELQRTKMDNQPVVISTSHFVPMVIVLSVGIGLGLISTIFEVEIGGISQHTKADIDLVKSTASPMTNGVRKVLSKICQKCKGLCLVMKNMCKKSDKVIRIEEDGEQQETE